MLVGIVANPMAGKDIRRLVAQADYVGKREKVNSLRRALVGLGAAGITTVYYLPDPEGLLPSAWQDIPGQERPELDLLPLEIPWRSDATDSTRAAEALASKGAGSILILGGDGTSRAVALGAGTVPLLALSSGTNNAFPHRVEATLAGLAAGWVARGIVQPAVGCRQRPWLDIRINGEPAGQALVDVALLNRRQTGARAVWTLSDLRELVASQGLPTSIGLSAIVGAWQPLSPDDPRAAYLRFGPAGRTYRVVASAGLIRRVSIEEGRWLEPGESLLLSRGAGLLALDGEPLLPVRDGDRVEIHLNPAGPWVIRPDEVLHEAARAGAFQDDE